MGIFDRFTGTSDESEKLLREIQELSQNNEMLAEILLGACSCNTGVRRAGMGAYQPVLSDGDAPRGREGCGPTGSEADSI
jgi:hypothetical protein